MSRCAMRWTTAGTNRVCSRCLELKDKIVGYTDEAGVTLPPLHPRCRCSIEYEETGAVRSVAECKNFGELKTYWAENYNVTVEASLKKLDFAAVKEASSGLEKAMQLIPSTRQYLREMRLPQDMNQNWLFSYNYNDRAVNFNPRFLTTEALPRTREFIAQNGAENEIARNTTLEAMAGHEMGHAFNFALMTKLGVFPSTRNFNKIVELYLKEVFKTLPKAERERDLWGQARRISKLKKYAASNWHETVPEAINDVIANAGKAQLFSRALVERAEATLSGDDFLTKHILSQDSAKLAKKYGAQCLDDVTVRKWYIWHDKQIPKQIDSSLSMEEKARRAFDQRNEYRTQARDLMTNQTLRRELDLKNPNPTWEGILKHKMEDKGMTYDEAIADIYETSTKSNSAVNRKLGLE